MDIHIVTKHDYEVSAGLGKTRWWKMSKKTLDKVIEQNGSVFLHNGSKQPSFSWGKVIDYSTRKSDGKFEIHFEVDNSKELVEWPGKKPHGNPFTIVEN